jgi:hypothetical protein
LSTRPGGSSVPSIDAAFDVANTITFAPTPGGGANDDFCNVFLGAPSVTITIQ